MKFENTKVYNFEGAFRGMRNPKNSWKRSDSDFSGEAPVLGENDLNLAQSLIKAGSEHRKFMRQIFVSVDITAPMYFWKEFDTYKVGTVRNSCSTMHKIHVKEFDANLFTHDAIDQIETAKDHFKKTIKVLEDLRQLFNITGDKAYWRAIIQLLPDGYNMKSTVTMDYENLIGICSAGQRRYHKLNEWSGIDELPDENFIEWAKTLPYADELIFIK